MLLVLELWRRVYEVEAASGGESRRSNGKTVLAAW